jgi:hypothetical protein
MGDISCLPIGLGILSWKGHDSLSVSLETYRAKGLLDYVQEKAIFLPEQRPQETTLATSYGLDIYGHPQNLGILGGFKALAQSLTSDIIVMVENDCPLIVDTPLMQQQLITAYQMIQSGKADIVRLRSRQYPGQDWGVNRKYRTLYPPENASWTQKMMMTCWRALRPEKAMRLAGWSVYENAQEAQKFPHITNYHADQDAYLLDSAFMTWTNQSIMVRKDFFLNKIIAYAENAPTTRRINGFRNLEIEMNSDYWRTGGFKIWIPQGIFTHKRIGERGYIIPR